MTLNHALPSKKKIQKTLQKVFPHAHFAFTGPRKLELRYNPPGRKESAPICECPIPDNGTVTGAMNALLTAAFKSLGFAATWESKFPGKYVFKPIQNFTGPETLIPAEMDPTVTTEKEALEMATQSDPALNVKSENDPAVPESKN